MYSKEQILDTKFEIIVTVDWERYSRESGKSGKMGSAGLTRYKDGRMAIAMNLFPGNIFANGGSIDDIKDTIRHELQHITQELNGAAIKYAKMIQQSAGDPKKIQQIPSTGTPKEFGIGKQKTGLRQIGKERGKEAGLSDREIK